MLTNLAYFKLLKSLPEDTLTNVNSQLVLLAAAGALNKVPEPSAPDIAVNDILASADFLKQQGLLECLAAHFPPPSIDLSPSSLSGHVNLPSPTRPTTSAQSSAAAVTSASSPERNCLSPPKLSSEHNSDLIPTLLSDGHGTSPCRAGSTSPTSVKEEPKSPGNLKASFRPVTSKSSPPGTPLTSTVHWGGASNGPPPNKTCTSSTTTSLSKLHPCDTSILNLLNPYKTSISLENKLQKFCLSGKGETSSVTSTLTNINWSSGSSNLSGQRRSYNCYWMSHVGPCNRQFMDKDDLYKHLKSHVNDLEALTPATAMLQPLNPTCVNCDKNRGFTKVHGRYQPYSKCSKFSRCACRR
ncbi:uncharacterized protein LOC134824232 [Bolinopsis microptera]|uniref:uncharacterized protein LOC134824232 n=1 Tax=Bolinopsis microptera TaxID=2820187 RepID=UPI00307A459D